MEKLCEFKIDACFRSKLHIISRLTLYKDRFEQTQHEFESGQILEHDVFLFDLRIAAWLPMLGRTGIRYELRRGTKISFKSLFL